MKTRSIIALCLCLVFQQLLNAQKTRTSSININNASNPGDRARLIVQKILDVDGRSAMVSIKVKEDRTIKNAMAWMDGSARLIKYNPEFLEKFDKDPSTKSAIFVLFAHEVGHHVLPNHSIEENDCTRKQKLELEADLYAGRIMNMLCIEKEDAVNAFKNMAQDISSGCYPRPQVRESTFKKGWSDQESSYSKDGLRHPCDVPPFPLKLQDKANNNLSQNVKARIIQGNIMEVNYFLPASKIKYAVFFGVSPSATIDKPRKTNIEWSENPTQGGTSLVMKWNFGKDNLSMEDVYSNPDWFGVMAYAPKYVPARMSDKSLRLCISCIAVGAASVGYGIFLHNKAHDKHNIYKNNRDPSDGSVYPSPAEREILYNDANTLHKISLGLMGLGGGSILYCSYNLWQKSKKDKQFKKYLFYEAQ